MHTLDRHAKVLIADSLRNGTTSADWPSMSKPCPWCSGPWNQVYHSGVCPRVRAIDYHPNGMIKRIEFWPEEAPPRAEGELSSPTPS